MDDSIFSTAVLPIALAVIMVSLGMSLTLADFRRVVEQPRGVAIGLLNLLVLSPLLAFAIAEAFNLDPVFAVGLVLLGASPGGILANLMTHFGRGDTALSITMTAISSVAAVVTVPLFLKLATHHFGAGQLDMSVNMVGIVARVLLITVVPLALGMWLRVRREVTAHFRVLNRDWKLPAGSEMLTEISVKFQLPDLRHELGAHGLEPVRTWTDHSGDFSLTLTRAT